MIEHNKEILIANIDRIDQFIADRAKTVSYFIDGNTGNNFNISDGKLLMKYHDLCMYAKSIGFIIKGSIISKSDEMSQGPDNEEEVKKRN